ncbi:MFS transporter [Peribacillus simplex]|uniref:MFS transporter n=1 Tax=Peribacillus simplex TaxID=1478 RepID=UPI00366E3BE2
MEGNVGREKQKYIILGLLFITWIINYLDKLSINIAVIPIAKEFHLNESQTGLIISVFFMSYAVMQLIGGWLSDKYGSRKIILISLLLWSVFTILTGYAWSFISLIVIRLLFGLGEGSFPAASSLALAESFPKAERGRAKSVLTSATTIGGLLSTVIAASLITTIGWRSLFYAFGILGILMSVLLFFFLKPPVTENVKDVEQKATKVPFKKLLKMPMLWQLMIMYFGVSIVNWGLASWMPSYLVKVKHLDLVSMGAISMIPAAVGFISVLTTGWIIDKFMVGREKYLIIIGAIISGVCVYLMAHAPSIPLVITYQSINNIGALLATTTILTLPLKYFSPGTIGTAVGFMYFGGQLAGAISPSIMGFVISLFNGSYNAAFIFLMLAMIIPIITALTLRTKDSSPEVLQAQVQ